MLFEIAFETMQKLNYIARNLWESPKIVQNHLEIEWNVMRSLTSTSRNVPNYLDIEYEHIKSLEIIRKSNRLITQLVLVTIADFIKIESRPLCYQNLVSSQVNQGMVSCTYILFQRKRHEVNLSITILLSWNRITYLYEVQRYRICETR